MKVLHLRNSPFLGSPEKLILAQIGALKGEVNQAVAVLPDGNRDFYEAARKEVLESFLLEGGLSAISQLRRILQENRYDILCTHDYKSNFIGKRASRGLGIRQIAVFHGRTGHSLKMKLYEALDDRILKTMDAIVSVSRSTAEKLSFLYGNAHVIHNALDMDSMVPEGPEDLRAKLGLASADILMGTAGRLSPEKGHQLLLDAFAGIARVRKNCHLLIAGEGPLRGKIESEIKRLGLEKRVHMLGLVRDMASFYKAIDFFVLPSFTEGLPMVLLEAAFYVKTAVSSRVGGVPEVIRHEENGLMVPAGDAGLLAESVLRLCEDKDMALRLGRNARQNLEKNFTIGKHAAQYLELYKRVLEPKKLWISWESHRRTRELSAALGTDLVELNLKGSRWVKHPRLLCKTFSAIKSRRPDVLVTQCPSIVLGVWAGLLKKFFGYKWVADCHNEAVQPFNFSSGFYSGMIRFIHRNADACVVTNDRLKETVEKNGGRVFVLPDKVPVLDGRKPEPAGGKVKAVFICTYAPDEPYAEVVQAAKYLGSSTEFYITGNPAKADPNVIKGLPDNIHLTGYLKDEDYLRLLAEADVLVDLTLMEDCLVCGGYEAVALGKPLVTSDTQALRSYFRRGSLYAKPDARSLAEAIGEALRRKEELSREMAAFRPELEKSWQSQKEILSRFIDGQEK